MNLVAFSPSVILFLIFPLFCSKKLFEESFHDPFHVIRFLIKATEADRVNEKKSGLRSVQKMSALLPYRFSLRGTAHLALSFLATKAKRENILLSVLPITIK